MAFGEIVGIIRVLDAGKFHKSRSATVCVKARIIAPCAHLACVMRDHQIHIAVAININEIAQEGIMNISHARRLGDIRKSIIPIILKNQTARAICMVVKARLAHNKTVLNIGRDIHIDMAVIIDIAQRNRKRRGNIIKRQIKAGFFKHAVRVVRNINIIFAGDDKIIPSIFIYV